MYAIDLFCGAGGMSEGILQAGFHILFSNDINESVELTYTNRHKQLGYIQGYNTVFRRADIRELTGEYILNQIRRLRFWEIENKKIPNEIDVIFGGPPCQGFSLAGRRNADDPRNMLFREYVRIINEIRPKYVVMENVTGFMNTNLENFSGISGVIYNSEVAPNILKKELELIGYNVLEPRILDASNFGVPQARKRAIFIAYRKDVKEPQYPIGDKNRIVTITEAIGDLIVNNNIREKVNVGQIQYQLDSIGGRTPNVNGRTIHSNNNIYNYELSTHSEIIRERFSLYRQGESTFNLKERIKSEGIDLSSCINLLRMLSNNLNIEEEQLISLFRDGKVTDDMLKELLTKKNMRRRLDGASIAATVVSLPDDFISPFENRTLSVREMARLQSFDDSFEFLGPRTTGGNRRRLEVPQYTQVGNAVPPLLARAIALEIMRVLKKEY
ncbi:DNA cytosine methyltransferase [Clostridium perfringens]|uniref:DNA cytosine methyltransferase n=1 Tax=Clostridium perfringens TaxID=1502 RepID=UPI0018E42B16|nr:DNA cytosine methyltransferase [Clostridium perfringens]MBI6020215.1 DNA cytosine methyltransferase [Clostridium perfringens]